jgi:hypothetical protein
MSVCVVACVVVTSVSMMAQKGPDQLTRARQAYNAQQFDEAIVLATAARSAPALADSASLVMARALLERFRRGGDVTDVATAREALLSVESARVTASETRELRLGMAELLFVDEQYGAAAEVFEAALDWPQVSGSDHVRDRLLEWWASSLDRYAQLAHDSERPLRYRRLLTRLELEVTRGVSSPVVTYWLAAAARGADDPDRAWSLAIAGWVQAPLIAAEAQAAVLRTDLDRLMREAIIPERARRTWSAIAPAANPAIDIAARQRSLEAEWEVLKKRWGSAEVGTWGGGFNGVGVRPSSRLCRRAGRRTRDS